MRVLVTGATGFIGLHTARALVAAGHAVRALRRPESRSVDVGVPLGGGHLEWVEGDLLDPATLGDAVAGIDAVIHAAGDVLQLGSPAARAHQRLVNVEGTRNLIEAAVAARVRRFVHTSSVSALGRPSPGTLGNEDTPYDWPPGLAYPESKRDGERLALKAGERGLDVVVLSPAMVLGPDDPRRRLSTLLRAVRMGLVRVAPPGGLTLCDVRHVADAHVAALTAGRPGERYVLGGPHVTYRELFAEFAAALSAPGPLLTVPPDLFRLAAIPFAGLAFLGIDLGANRLVSLGAERYFSSAKAMAELGYRETPAADLVRDTVAWYEAT